MIIKGARDSMVPTVATTQINQERPRYFRSVVVTRRGSLDGVEIFANELRDPQPNEVRVRVFASGVHQDDVAARTGNRPFLPKLPFVPGYDVVGVVDAIGNDVKRFVVGDRVGALTVLGSHAEIVYLPEDKLVQVPATLDPADAVAMILNYLVAYQVLYRVAKVNTGDRALIIGASGGVGTAFLQLGRLAGLKLYGTASPSKFGTLSEFGAEPIDYHTQDFVDVIHRSEADGLEFVFNGMGEDYIKRGISVLKRGGMLVHYGAPRSVSAFLRLLAYFALFNLMPNGKSLRGYGTHRVNQKLLVEDWNTLFQMVEDGRIKPVIEKRFRLPDGAIDAYALLESGRVTGNIVLLAPELIDASSA